jgi:protein-S-isoprenylcysteine O-methyltransferase Ste14
MSRLFVWAGGALFAASIALCAWWYVVVLAVPGRDLMLALTGRRALAVPPGLWSLAFNTFVFSMFAAHHSLFARAPVKARVSRVVPEPLMRSAYVWTASLLLILVLVAWSPIGGTIYRATGWRAAIHAAAQLAGLLLVGRAVSAIDALALAGIRPEPADEALQVRGPYRWVRHPLYSGWVLAVFGAAHMTADRLAFAVITTIYLIIAVPWEERALLRSFGEDYRRYQARVRWRIVPYVY